MFSDFHKSCPRLSPASFTMIMGTGAFASATKDMAQVFPWLEGPAIALNWINFILFAILLALAAYTWPRNLAAFLEDMESPHATAFYAALGISLLVLASQALKFGLGNGLALALWTTGCVLTLLINFAIFFHFFEHARMELGRFTPVFYIPVGGVTVIPVAGVPLMELSGGLAKDLILMADTLAVGAGLLLYVGLFSLMLQRHFLLEPLPEKLTPVVWINMAPLGWGAVSFLALGQSLCGAAGDEIVMFLARLLWGGVFWWLIMAILLTLRAARHMEFSLAFWGFIFPLGAFVLLSGKLGRPFLPAFVGGWTLMAALWCVCAARTLWLIWKIRTSR